MQFSTLVLLCFCPATELVISVPLPAPRFLYIRWSIACPAFLGFGAEERHSRKIVFHCIIIIVIRRRRGRRAIVTN